MKIVCLRCKKTIGEQAPYNDPAEAKAKCAGCLAKEKELASQYKPSPELKDGQEVTLKKFIDNFIFCAIIITRGGAAW